MKGAPVAFFGLLAIGIGLAIVTVWLGMEWRYRAQIEILHARVEQKDDIIQEVRRQLDGVPPEEITNEIRKLKDTIEKIQDRHVSVESRSVTENEDGTFAIETTILVTSSYAPNVLIIYAQAEGIISIDAGGRLSSVIDGGFRKISLPRVLKRLLANTQFLLFQEQSPSFSRLASSEEDACYGTWQIPQLRRGPQDGPD